MNLDHALHEVHDPVVRNAGARVDRRFSRSVQGQTGLGDLDDEHGVGRRLGEVIARGASDHRDVRLWP